MLGTRRLKGVGGGEMLQRGRGDVRMGVGGWLFVRVAYPRVVCGVALLLASEVRVPSRLPLLGSSIDGGMMGGAAVA